MSDLLYKARWTFRHSDVLKTSKHDGFELRLWEWLRENDALRHYVNSYINTDDATDTMEYVVVMRDRDSALKLKLSL
ncbi:hypothetical protein IFT67_12465 [Sphingomonas sp. CFBP 13728]|uniref:hypothetical protein n=1 Tax=Sphingomonas sp. CFBP 13728 TaxID=2775294 RepID=UPI00177F40FB|nr:hypothetical protein [Sphingomonas sp. CFBP 13728]MBD8619735.1 hypothetical protein [Sphingomonas sp. CFBP 13728]